MRSLIVAAIVMAIGCTGTEPVEPIAKPAVGVARMAWVWGLIVDQDGVCIPGATVLIARGQHAGETLTQKTPCDAWAYTNGFILDGLDPGVEMTLQASAPGFEVQEKTFITTSGPQMAMLFTPSRKK